MREEEKLTRLQQLESAGLAVDLMTLAMQLDVPDHEILRCALANMRVIMGFRAAGGEDPRLLAPLLVLPLGPKAVMPGPGAPLGHPGQEGRGGAGSASRAVLEAAAAREAPFSAASLAAETGISATRIGMILTHARWPAQKARDRSNTWLPKPKSPS